MAVVGLALVAAPMLLTMQFAALSNRPDVLLDTALKGSLYPANLAQLVVANIFGSQRRLLGSGSLDACRRSRSPTIRSTTCSSARCRSCCCSGSASSAAARSGAAALLLTGDADRWRSCLRSAATRRSSRGRSNGCRALSKFRRPVDANFVFVAALALLAGTSARRLRARGRAAPRVLLARASRSPRARSRCWPAAVMFSARIRAHGGGADARC